MGCGFSHRVEPNASGEPGGPELAGSGVGNSFVGDAANATATAVVQPAKDLPLSFIVPIRDQEDLKEGSLIRRHPPVRLRRLEEEQQVHRPKLTLGALERRQAEAEERRRKILDSRVQSAQHFQRHQVQPGTGTTTLGSQSPSTTSDHRDREGPDKEEPEVDHRKHPEELPSLPAPPAPAFG